VLKAQAAMFPKRHRPRVREHQESKELTALGRRCSSRCAPDAKGNSRAVCEWPWNLLQCRLDDTGYSLVDLNNFSTSNCGATGGLVADTVSNLFGTALTAAH
jgi:hypothetical protein